MEPDVPYDPVSHGGGGFLLVGPVLGLALKQDPVLLDWTQTPAGALRPVGCTPALQEQHRNVQTGVTSREATAAVNKVRSCQLWMLLLLLEVCLRYRACCQVSICLNLTTI